MSTDQKSMQCFSLLGIVQEVDFTYHAPGITSKGLGPLAAAVAPANPPQGQDAETGITISVPLATIARGADGYPADQVRSCYASCSYLRDYAVVADSATTDVADWYDTLRALQRQALGGARRARISYETLQVIEREMEPVNLGKVVKVKLQARWWSPVKEPEMYPCKSGGFARVVTAATFYFAGSNSVNQVADWLKTNYGKTINGFKRTVTRSTVMFEDRGRTVRTTVSPGGGVLTRENGDKTERVSVARLRQKSDEFRDRIRSIKKMDLGSVGKKPT